MKKLIFDDFVYQIICNGQSIIVCGDEDAARQYVEDHLKSCGEVMILPISVFDYAEGGEE